MASQPRLLTLTVSRKRRRAFSEKYLARSRAVTTKSPRPSRNPRRPRTLSSNFVTKSHFSPTDRERSALNDSSSLRHWLADRAPVGGARADALLAHQNSRSASPTRFASASINIESSTGIRCARRAPATGVGHDRIAWKCQKHFAASAFANDPKAHQFVLASKWKQGEKD